MKNLLLIACFAASLAACKKDEDRTRDSRNRWIDGTADQLSQSLIYFTDHRTGLCFAITWVGSYDGGPAMASVPCENARVQRLLTNGSEGGR